MAASDQIPGQEYEYVQIPIVRGDQDPPADSMDDRLPVQSIPL